MTEPDTIESVGWVAADRHANWLWDVCINRERISGEPAVENFDRIWLETTGRKREGRGQ